MRIATSPTCTATNSGQERLQEIPDRSSRWPPDRPAEPGACAWALSPRARSAFETLPMTAKIHRSWPSTVGVFDAWVPTRCSALAPRHQTLRGALSVVSCSYVSLCRRDAARWHGDTNSITQTSQSCFASKNKHVELQITKVTCKRSDTANLIKGTAKDPPLPPPSPVFLYIVGKRGCLVASLESPRSSSRPALLITFLLCYFVLAVVIRAVFRYIYGHAHAKEESAQNSTFSQANQESWQVCKCTTV